MNDGEEPGKVNIKMLGEAQQTIHDLKNQITSLNLSEAYTRRIADTLQSASLALTRSLDLDDTLETLLDSLHQLVPYDSASVMLFEEEDACLTIRAIRGFENWTNNQHLIGTSIDLQDSRSLRMVLGTRESVLISNTYEFSGWERVKGTEYIVSWLGVPLVSGERVIGIYSMDKSKEGFFTSEHARLAEMLAAHGAVAIENARLLDDIKNSNRKLQNLVNEHKQLQSAEHEQRLLAEALQEITALLISSLDLDEVFDSILTHVARVVPYDGCSILLIKGDEVEVTHAKGFDKPAIGMRFPLHRWNLLQVMETGRPVLIDDTHASDIWIVNPDVRWIRTNLTAAITVEDQVIGFLCLDRKKPNSFTSEHIERLQVFANQAGIAVQNAHLYTTIEHARQSAEILRSAHLAMSQSLDMDVLIENLLDYLQELVPFESATVFLLEGESILKAYGVRGYKDMNRALPVEFEITHDSSMDIVVTSEKGLIIPDTSKFDGWLNVPEKDVVLSFLGVPMLAGGKVIGICSMDSSQKNFFSDEHKRLAEALATQGAFAVENARLYAETTRLLEESQQRADELDALRTTMSEITTELELPVLLHAIVERAASLLNATSGELGLFDEVVKQVRVVVSYQMDKDYVGTCLPLGVGSMGRVAETSEPLLLDDYQKWEGRLEVYEDIHLHANILAPLKVANKLLGVISIATVDPARKFDQADVHLLSLFARQAAIAIENARLFSELESQKQYSESMLLNSPAAIVAVDKNGIVEAWNPAAERLFGYRQSEAVGENLDELVTNSPEMLMHARDITDNTIAGSPLHTITQRSQKNGTLVDVEILSVPFALEEQDISMLVIYHDITELKRIEGELRDAQAAAEQANEAKSAFLASVSHELRTPLTSILGFTKIIENRLNKRIFPQIQMEDNKVQRSIKQVNENLKIITTEGERLTALINNVLDLAKIEAGKVEWQMESVVIADIVDQAAAATSALVTQKNLQFNIEIEKDLPKILGDADRLVQVLINLFSNAIKFTDEGSITCIVTRIKKDIQISVIDTGIGIEEDNLEVVFEQFKQVGDTLTEKPTGSGLGLPICKEIIEHHGGRIWVESVPGQGSTFSFILPVQNNNGVQNTR